MIGERGPQIREAGANCGLDAIYERRELLGRALRGCDLRFERVYAGRALLQLGDELGNLVGERDRLREPFLFAAHRGELGLQNGDVELALRDLRFDLAANSIDEGRQHPITEHMQLKLVDECVFHLVAALVHRDGTDRAPAIAMTRASVRDDALVAATVCSHSLRCDRAAACSAMREAAERILRRPSLPRRKRGATRREPRLHCGPRCVVDDAPLRDLGRDDVLQIGLDVCDAASAPHLLDAAVEVHAAITRVEQNRAYRAGSPRAATATPGGRRAYAFIVQAVRDRLDAVAREALGEDPPHDLRFLFVDDGDRVFASRRIGLAFERVAEAAAASDATVADSRAQCFARARANRFELHLVAGALDERRRLIDRVREEHLLAGRVVVELAAAIAHEIANDERDLDGIAAESRLISAHDHVIALGFRDQRLEAGARVEVVACATVVDIVAPLDAREAEARDHLAAPGRLHVKAEHLLAFVVLRASAVGSDHHRFNPSSSLHQLAERRESSASPSIPAIGPSLMIPSEISARRTSTRRSTRMTARPSPTGRRFTTGQLSF